MSKFNLIMLSAMYENGGNTTHRFLDGHPELFVYPFESQPGTSLVNDYMTSLFPQKYRWPEFSLSGNFSDDYEMIIDEELKRHVKTPEASKFKNAKMQLTDPERKKIFLDLLKRKARTRANIIEAFFVSTFNAWKDYHKSGKEKFYVGYSPIIGVDADKIVADFPTAHIVHVIRNPYSAYADTKKRAVPLSLNRYIRTWNIVQMLALNFSEKYPKNFHILKFEDMIESPKKFWTQFGKKIGLTYSPTLEERSWNGKTLEITVPWGTLQKATPQSNKKTADELSKQEHNAIHEQSRLINETLGYDKW